MATLPQKINGDALQKMIKARFSAGRFYSVTRIDALRMRNYPDGAAATKIAVRSAKSEFALRNHSLQYFDLQTNHGLLKSSLL